MGNRPLINIESARRIIESLKSSFDSHDFIMTLALSDTVTYLGLLRRFHRVITTNQKIGDYLLKYSEDLDIYKIGEINSENLLGNPSKCGLWEKKQLL